MTPLREAVVLPAIFLTVSLLGGFRLADSVRLVPPSLTALVLAVLLLGTLTRGGVLVPQAFLHGARTPLENLSGTVVLLTAFAASAQVINLVLPERGLLHAAFAIFLFGQLMTMNAAGGGRVGLLRSLLVLLGSLFVLRYIIVEALYSPGGGLLHRVLTTLMAGVTLGGIEYQPNGAATGYVAFATLLLYVVGILLLAPGTATTTLVPARTHAPNLPTTLAIAVLAISAGCSGAERGDTEPVGAADVADSGRGAVPKAGDALVSDEQRTAALRRAQVWHAPGIPVSRMNFKEHPTRPGTLAEGDLECTLVVRPMTGTTPKFDCAQPDGQVVRVKYGRGNAELYAEVAATRLLSGLGFGADRVDPVRKVRCGGCGAFPFQSLQCLAQFGRERLCFPRGVDYGQRTEFEHAVVERRMEGRRIEAMPDQGWAWYELDQVDASAGGAPRAHIDALRLLAVFIAHWDNKAENQRLLCTPGGDLPDGGCSRPFVMVHDLGASFGPTKLDLHNWRTTPVWSDPRTCEVTMEHLPWGGGTFPNQQISEEGRRFLLELLQQLSEEQLQDLFAGARIESSEGILAEGRQPASWATAFLERVRQVREAGPCPGAPAVLPGSSPSG